MPTTKQDISEWFDRGVKDGQSHMIIVCDTFDYCDYPSYAKTKEQAENILKTPGEMQRVMEVYNLSMDKEKQLNTFRVWNL